MNINGTYLYRSLYAQQTKQNALHTLLNSNAVTTKKSNHRYMYSHNNSQRLSFYNENRNQTQKLLDAVNFSTSVVSADPDGRGYFEFGEDGLGQMIPINVIPPINVQSLEMLYATNNKMALNSNSYYAYKGIDGNSYACAFNGSNISRAFSERILKNDMKNISTECRGNTASTMSILSYLAKGEVGGLHMFQRSSVKDKLANVGIKPGEFSISVDGKEKKYYLGEDGQVFTEKRVQETISMYNNNNWLNERNEVGDSILVFGKNYTINEEGHINVPTEGFFVNQKCNYGNA